MQAAFGVVCLVACASAWSNAASPNQTGDDDWDLAVEYGDCTTVLTGPVCVLPEHRTLRLWIGAPPEATFEVLVDERIMPIARRTMQQGGVALRIVVPDAGRRLTVRARAQGELREWYLALATETLPGFVAVTGELMRRGDHARAHALLERALASGHATHRGIALGLLARLYLREERRDDAYDAITAAIGQSLADGRPAQGLRQTNLLAFLLINEWRRFAAVAALYEPYLREPNPPAETAFFSAYYTGWAASDAGNSRHALARLRRAAEQAQRMGWQRRQLDAEQALFLELLNVGRRDEAAAVLAPWRDALPDGLDDCEQAHFENNLEWSVLLDLEAGNARDDPSPALARIRTAYDRHCNIDDRVNVRINLALAHYHAGRFQQAQQALDEARALTTHAEPRLELWWHDIAGRVALARDELAAASDQADKLRQLAALTVSPSARWRAAVASARLSEHLGRVDEAIAAYREADRIVDRDMQRIALFDGREALVAARARVTARHMRLLLDAERENEALALARAARLRVLRELDRDIANPQVEAMRAEYRALRERLEREFASSWTLPRDEREQRIAAIARSERDILERLDRMLSEGPTEVRTAQSPTAGELLLVFFPLVDGWVVFALDDAALLVQRPDCNDVQDEPTAIAACLVAAFRHRIRHAGRLVLLPTAALQQVDFHALPFADAQLVDHVTVVYSLDLPSAVDGPARAGAALLVGDPAGNLPGARRELAAVSETLSATGNWSLQRLQGRNAVAPAVREELSGAGLFHYAGHAQFAGRGGWESELALARRTRLGIADILALARAPQLVVLSGCETAVADDAAPVASIGLAQAFLTRGAARVIATSRPVADETAVELMRDFYVRWSRGADAAQALREAQLGLRVRRPDADWSAFRAILP